MLPDTWFHFCVHLSVLPSLYSSFMFAFLCGQALNFGLCTLVHDSFLLFVLSSVIPSLCLRFYVILSRCSTCTCACMCCFLPWEPIWTAGQVTLQTTHKYLCNHYWNVPLADTLAGRLTRSLARAANSRVGRSLLSPRLKPPSFLDSSWTGVGLLIWSGNINNKNKEELRLIGYLVKYFV